jgi:hypothetical protein
MLADSVLDARCMTPMWARKSSRSHQDGGEDADLLAKCFMVDGLSGICTASCQIRNYIRFDHHHRISGKGRYVETPELILEEIPKIQRDHGN